MIKAIKGTKDIFPPEIDKWQFLEDIVYEVFSNFNYDEIRTPIFELTQLFSRGIGESTDIVGKEMYTFTDRSGNSVTLKPEMTASVVRAVLEHSMHKTKPLNKLFYVSPMFRQERPQAGRLRQFHQFGAEALGSNNPYLDAEMILIPYIILQMLGLSNYSVKINSLGVPESREKYKTVLREYLAGKLNNLSEESRRRYDTNILRIFDSKAENDIEIMKDAPVILDYLSNEDIDHFEEVRNLLDDAHIEYEVDSKLVRGLDYYTNTTFEIVSTSVGAQSALCGGGRYNLLAKQLGGVELPAVGFAAGIERILLACKNEGLLELDDYVTPLYIVAVDKAYKRDVYNLALYFRGAGVTTELDLLGRSVKAQMREANKLNAKFVLFVGGDEYANQEIVLKNMENGEQNTFNLDSLEDILDKLSSVEEE
jgi:histidyl-tRNA synthetase